MLPGMERPAFPFDRAAHRREDLGYLEDSLTRPDSLLLPVADGQNLVRMHESRVELFMPTLAEAGSLIDAGGELVWLGELSGQACFALDVSHVPSPEQHPAIPTDVEPRDLRFLIARLQAELAQLAGYARGMLYWHQHHRYCGTCGAPTRPRKGGHLRVCTSEGCGRDLFPRTDPAVLVLVRSGDRVLLGRQPKWPTGMYSTLAGFVEPGESLEEAVVREVAEETGVQVGQPVYRASQSWPFPASLMVGFEVEAVSEAITLGDEELEDARWFTLAELQNPTLPGFFVPPPGSLAGNLLQAVRDRALK